MSDKELEESKRKEKRFVGYMEKYVVTVRLKKEFGTNDRNTNMLTITKQLKQDRIRPEKMLENSFTAMDLEFGHKEEANKCLDITEQEERAVTYVIKSKTLQCRGVISSWDGKVEEFLQEIDEKEKIVNCERIKVKKWIRKREYLREYHQTFWQLLSKVQAFRKMLVCTTD